MNRQNRNEIEKDWPRHSSNTKEPKLKTRLSELRLLQNMHSCEIYGLLTAYGQQKIFWLPIMISLSGVQMWVNSWLIALRANRS